MFRLQVWYNKHWKWGINDYDTLESANARIKELAKVGIKARVKPRSELFN